MTEQRQAFLERLSVSRPGYRLVDVVDAAIPMFVAKADVLLIERRSVGPIEEFVLKAIEHGFVTSGEISGVLGLEQPLVVDTIVRLQIDDCLYQVVQGGHREMRLTKKGAAVLETDLREGPARAEVRIGFDRLLWRVTSMAQGHLMRPAELDESGRAELRPAQRRRLKSDDLELDDIEREVRLLRTRAVKPTVLAVERIVRSDRLFLPVDLAIFDSSSGGSPQVAVLVDGRPSEAHESALDRLGGLEFIGATLAPDQPDLVESLVADYGAVEAEELVKQGPTRDERARRALDRAAVAPVEVAVDRPVEAVSPPAVTSGVDFIDTYQHRQYLDDALATSKWRLVIVSPWISGTVVNADFLERLAQSLRRGVRVHIGYGLDQRPGERPATKADQRAEEALLGLARRHDNLTIAKLGNTHSKQLLFDDVHISGSFNWLSFRGTRSRAYRHEESTVVRIKSKVDAKYADLCQRIEQAVRSPGP